MTNEWGVGYISNRHRIFLGRWPYDDHLFPICYESCVMRANWRFDRRGEALQTFTTYLDKLDNYENLSEEDSVIGTYEECYGAEHPRGGLLRTRDSRLKLAICAGSFLVHSAIFTFNRTLLPI
jgi:hypothetical protein